MLRLLPINPVRCSPRLTLIRQKSWAFSRRFKSSLSAARDDCDKTTRSGEQEEIQRLKHLRNVGIIAHVDAGKTTVTESKLKELGEINLASMVVDENFAIIDDRLAYSTQEKAEKAAKDLACSGFHVHEYEGKEWYMPCKEHTLSKHKCPEGYEKKKKERG